MPALKLNARSIPTLKAHADGRRAVYRDTVVPGLYLEAHGSGRRTFGVWFRVNGRATRLTLGPWQAGVFDLADARIAARDALHLARKGEDPAQNRRQRREANTLGALIETFLAGIEGHVREKTLYEWGVLLRHPRLAALRAMKPEDVQRADIIRVVERIAESAAYSANRTFEVLRRCYSWAMQKALVGHTPCVGVAKPTKEKPRSRFYSDDELRRIVRALDEVGKVGDALKLCLYTGVRISSALGAKWSEFDLLDKHQWLIPGERAGSKNATDWLVPLAPPVVKLLMRLQAGVGESEYVFPVRKREGSGEGPSWRQSRAMYAIREKAALPDAFRPHDFRRSLNTWLASQRVPREVRDAVLGHKPPRLEGTYNIYDHGAEKRKALERWVRHVERLTTTATAEEKIVPMVRA
jgi:integrase